MAAAAAAQAGGSAMNSISSMVNTSMNNETSRQNVEDTNKNNLKIARMGFQNKLDQQTLAFDYNKTLQFQNFNLQHRLYKKNLSDQYSQYKAALPVFNKRGLEYQQGTLDQNYNQIKKIAKEQDLPVSGLLGIGGNRGIQHLGGYAQRQLNSHYQTTPWTGRPSQQNLGFGDLATGLQQARISYQNYAIKS